MKRKILTLLLAFALLLLASCKEEHTHEYSDKYSADGESHWYECDCDEKKDAAAHTFDEGVITIYPTTDSEGQKLFTCSVCGYEKNEVLSKLEAGHTHSFNKVGKDDAYHWNECDCKEKSGKEEHSFDDGKLNADGDMEYTCQCGYKIISDVEEDYSLTEEEFKAQPAMFGSPWVSSNTRMKILVQIKMSKGTKITFLGDTSVYCWGVMETNDKDNASQGVWKDSGWNTGWDDPTLTTYTTSYTSGYFVITVGKLDSSGNPTIALTQTELDNIHSMFKVEGMKVTGEGVLGVNNPQLSDEMKGINHRGWYEAPENTLPAYRESYNHGFKFVECDVQFTKDGIPVLLHDDTIDRTSDGSGYVNQLTYQELLQYDFSYDSNDTVQDFSAYRGTRIPTFEEFIALCKELSLHPYIEIKGNITEAEAQKLVKTVSDADMLDDVSWLSFSGDALAKIASYDATARLVWVITGKNETQLKDSSIPYAQLNLMTGESEVVFDLYYTGATQGVADLLKEYNIPLEVWTVNDENAIRNLNPYVSGVSSDMYNAETILADGN